MVQKLQGSKKEWRGENEREEMTDTLRKWKEGPLGKERGPESNEVVESPRMRPRVLHANQNLI